MAVKTKLNSNAPIRVFENFEVGQGKSHFLSELIVEMSQSQFFSQHMRHSNVELDIFRVSYRVTTSVTY